MSTQKFSTAEREAIWLAYKKKCAYTGEPLDFNSFHIDHIIPEYLQATPERLEEIITEYKLSVEFSLTSYYNVVPCKPGVNLQKGGLILDKSKIHYFLGIAASNVNHINNFLRKIQKRNDNNRALILLQQCLEHGSLSEDELASVLEKYGNSPQEIFRLTSSLEFADLEDITEISKAEITDLRMRPARYEVLFINDADEERLIQNCKEYDLAISDGYYGKSNYDIKQSAYLSQQCGLLKAIESARIPDKSFISNPRVGIVDLNLLPIALFPYIGEKDGQDTSESTYQDYITRGDFVVKRIRSNMLCIEEPHGMGQHLTEVARADFTGDGLESILLFEYCYATEGTLGFGGVTILTRDGEDKQFRIIPY